MKRALVFACLGISLGCSRAPDDLREWKASDHDHTAEPTQSQVTANAPSRGGMFGISEVVLAAWKTNCVTCHGVIGRGDGPQGPMTKPRDLTDPTWQATVSDDDIKSAILNGRGAMPAFKLPDDTVGGLVKLVRLLNRNRVLGDGGASDAATDAPGAAASDAAKSDGGTQRAGDGG